MPAPKDPKKRERWIKKRSEYFKKHHHSGMWKEGHIPANKGKTKETYEPLRRTSEKMKEQRKGKHYSPRTEFKKGHKFPKEIEERRLLNSVKKTKGIPKSEEHKRKIGLGNEGKIISEETRKKQSITMKGKHSSPDTEFKKGQKSQNPFKKGEQHPAFNNWSSLEPYDKNFNNKFKRAIRKRDNQVCMLCGIHREKLKQTLEIHHINYDKKLTIPQNCISLCKSCHSLTQKDREHWTKLFQSILSKQYNYQYSEKGEAILKVK